MITSFETEAELLLTSIRIRTIQQGHPQSRARRRRRRLPENCHLKGPSGTTPRESECVTAQSRPRGLILDAILHDMQCRGHHLLHWHLDALALAVTIVRYIEVDDAGAGFYLVGDMIATGERTAEDHWGFCFVGGDDAFEGLGAVTPAGSVQVAGSGVAMLEAFERRLPCAYHAVGRAGEYLKTLGE